MRTACLLTVSHSAGGSAQLPPPDAAPRCRSLRMQTPQMQTPTWMLSPWVQTPPEQTDACDNFTLHQTLIAGGKNRLEVVASGINLYTNFKN